MVLITDLAMDCRKKNWGVSQHGISVLSCVLHATRQQVTHELHALARHGHRHLLR